MPKLILVCIAVPVLLVPGALLFSGAAPFYLLLSSAIASLTVALLAVALLGWASRGWSAEAGSPATGAEGMIGEVGVVRVPVGCELPGRVFVHGERWRAIPAVAPEEGDRERERFIGVGRKVRVVEVRDGEVVVEPVESEGSGGRTEARGRKDL